MALRFRHSYSCYSHRRPGIVIAIAIAIFTMAMTHLRFNHFCYFVCSNANETAIGTFAPPPGGAELLDPRMRRSTEFAGWVDANLAKLKSAKTVMTFCTAGASSRRNRLRRVLSFAFFAHETRNIEPIATPHRAHFLTLTATLI